MVVLFAVISHSLECCSLEVFACGQSNEARVSKATWLVVELLGNI